MSVTITQGETGQLGLTTKTPIYIVTDATLILKVGPMNLENGKKTNWVHLSMMPSSPERTEQLKTILESKSNVTWTPGTLKTNKD